MVEGLIGKKIGMTQQYDEQGNAIPVTIIQVGPCTVIQRRTEEKDGYSALQLGFIEEKAKRKPNKALEGHFQKSGFCDDLIEECHGSIHHLQCTIPCCNEIWSARDIEVNVDECKTYEYTEGSDQYRTNEGYQA